MNKAFLRLVPKRYLCPYCGEWHENQEDLSLDYYDAPFGCADWKCPTAEKYLEGGSYSFHFDYDDFWYATEPLCRVRGLDGKVPISDFSESEDKPIVTVDVEFKSDRDISIYTCTTNCREFCNYFKSVKSDKRSMTITLGFEFDKEDYERVLGHKIGASAQKRGTRKKQDVSISAKEDETEPTTNKEDTTMAKKNSMFGMNVEFGLNKDENLKSTFMGVAVKTDDGWRTYNQSKNEITDIGDMELGNLPIYIIPTTKLSQGDLIKDGGEYYFVHEVCSGVNKMLSVKTGEIKTVIPVKNVMGFGIYSKVKALTADILGAEAEVGIEKMVLMSAMLGGSGDEEYPWEGGDEGNSFNKILPLLMLKSDMGENNDKMLMMAAMMNGAGSCNQGMNQILPLLMLKDDMSENSDKMLMMIAMMNGSGDCANNPMLMYMLMKDMMGGNKSDVETVTATPAKAKATKPRSSGKKETTPELQTAEKTPNGDKG